VDRAWHGREPDYDRVRRLQAKVLAAKESKAEAARQLPRCGPLSGLPWEVVQDEMQSQPAVILAGVLRLAVVRPQDAIRRQVAVLQNEFGGLRQNVAQDEIVRAAGS